MNSPRIPKTLPRYLADRIKAQRELGKTEHQIANEIGYERPHVLRLIVSGEIKLPLDCVIRPIAGTDSDATRAAFRRSRAVR